MIIEIEGISCAGKTTAALLVAEELKKQGLDISYAKEPGETPLGNLLRSHLLNKGFQKQSDLTNALLFFAIRADILDDERTSRDGHIWLFDRHMGSTFVYQALASAFRDDNKSDFSVKKLETLMTLVPSKVDLTIVLDLPPEEAYKRLMIRKEKEERKCEEEVTRKDFLKTNAIAREGFYVYFNYCCRKNKAHIVDASKSVPEVVKQILSKTSL